MSSDIPIEDDFEDSQDLLERRKRKVKAVSNTTVHSEPETVILVKAETETEGFTISTDLTTLNNLFGENTNFILTGVPVVFQPFEEPEPEPEIDPVLMLKELTEVVKRQQDFLNHLVVEIQTIKKSVTKEKPWYKIF